MATTIPHFSAFTLDPIAIATESDGTNASKLEIARAQMLEFDNRTPEEAQYIIEFGEPESLYLVTQA